MQHGQSWTYDSKFHTQLKPKTNVSLRETCQVWYSKISLAAGGCCVKIHVSTAHT